MGESTGYGWSWPQGSLVPRETCGSFKASIQERTTQDMTSMISKSEFCKVKIPVPPIKLQDEFAAPVSEVRTLQAAQGAARGKVEVLWGSLLGEVFN